MSDTANERPAVPAPEGSSPGSAEAPADGTPKKPRRRGSRGGRGRNRSGSGSGSGAARAEGGNGSSSGDGGGGGRRPDDLGRRPDDLPDRPNEGRASAEAAARATVRPEEAPPAAKPQIGD